MGRLIGDIQKPGGLAFPRVGQKIEGVVGDGVRGEEPALLVAPRRAAFGQARHHPRFPGIDRVAPHEPIEIIEAAHGRRLTVTDVPLAGHRSPVPRRPQHLGDDYTVRLKRTAITGPPFVAGHRAYAGLVRIESREQRGAGRAAAEQL